MRKVVYSVNLQATRWAVRSNSRQQRAEQIARLYPDGIRDLADGGTWNTLAGQPTDDSEMALVLARSLLKEGEYNRQRVRDGYREWLASEPFDCGNTISEALHGRFHGLSESNGALMRVSLDKD